MSKINRILCPVDMSPNSQNALRYALKIADQWKASIQVVHVIFPQAEGLDFPVMVAQATQNAIEAAQVALNTWIESTIAQVQVNYEFQEVPIIQEKIEIGAPVNSILNAAKNEESDLIIIGTKGQHNRLERLIGTVSGEIVRRPPCPVLLIPEPAEFQSIKQVSYASNLLASDCYYVWKMMQLLKPFTPEVDCVHIQTQEKEHTAIDKQDFSLFFNFTMPELQLKVFNLKEKDLTSGLEQFIEADRSVLLVMYKPKENFFQRMFFESQTKKMALVSKIPLLVMV